MNENQLTKIGKVFDAHGIRGDLVITVFSKDISWVGDAEILHLVQDGQTKIVEILKTRAHKKGFVCQLKGFDNRNLAEETIGSEVWVDSDLFTSGEGESLFLKELLHFEVTDKSLGLIGRIEAFSTNGIQDLLVVSDPQNQKQFDIPFVKEFVIQIDHTKKKLLMALPEGLLEINESSPDDEIDDQSIEPENDEEQSAGRDED